MHSYSLLLDTMGMPETDYQAFHEFEVMKAKHEFLFEQRGRFNSVKRLAMDMAVFSAFGEGMQLFSTFAILLSFKERGLMKGMSTIIEWSLKDETHHVESMIKLFRTFVQENPEIWTDHFKKEIYQTCREMVELEDRFIDLAFEQGDVKGCTAAETKTYIRYVADRRLLQLGLKPNYGVKENPYDWLDWMMTAHTHTNFFEGRATEYSKGGIKGWETGFNFLTKGS
jgi:ribonucleoside-diphosphate reductase beta chain